MIDLEAIGRKGEELFRCKSYLQCNPSGNGVVWFTGYRDDIQYKGQGHVGDYSIEFGFYYNQSINHDVALKLAELADYIQLLKESEDA